MKRNLALFLFLISCKFSNTPYTVEMPKFRQNNVAMKRILIEEPHVASDYKIAFLSDTHNYFDDLTKCVKAINRNGPYAFVIVTGDVTNEGLREEYLKTENILNKLKVPHLVVVGNHDLLANGQAIYEKLYGAKDFTFSYRNLSFVFVNNNNWESGGIVPNYPFIEKSFAEAPATNRILVAHVAPNDGDRFTSAEIQRLETLVDSLGVNFIFNGHNHNPGISTFGGATQITIGAPSKRVYSELLITSGGIFHQKISF